MAVIVGSARSDENGNITNGKAGDQTGKEVSTQDWYLHSKGWVLLRPDPQYAEKIAKCMEMACTNNNIGYDQNQRDTLYSCAKQYGFDVSKVSTPCETDCAALVRVCCNYAGITVGDFYTGNEATILPNTGKVKKITDAKYTTSSDYLQRGDILVTKTKGHTVIVLSNGSKVTAQQSSAGWEKLLNGQYKYKKENGQYAKNEWVLVNHHWYLFNGACIMQTGWVNWNKTTKTVTASKGTGQWFFLHDEKGSDLEGACYHECAEHNGALELWLVD